MFDKKPLKVQVIHRQEETLNDEREILLYKLMKEYPQLQMFEGLKLFTEYEEAAEPVIWYQTKMTPFKLCIGED